MQIYVFYSIKMLHPRYFFRAVRTVFPARPLPLCGRKGRVGVILYVNVRFGL